MTLVLGRKVFEEITIIVPSVGPAPARTIRVSVAKIKESQVLLGFDADRDIKILRSEIVKE